MYNYNISTLEKCMSSLYCYADKQRVKHDVETVLRQIPSLQPITSVFAHNNGTTSTLLNLTGTIPIYYNGNQYNIPVEIWLMENYPNEAPKCYVRPTQDMMIKPGHPHVDRDGLIMLPYSSNWVAHTHSLVELIGYQCSVFGNSPPVFRRPAEMQQQQMYYNQQPPQYNTASQRPAMPQSHQQHQHSNQYASYSPTPAVDPRTTLVSEATTKIQEELRRIYNRIREEMDSNFSLQMEFSEGSERLKNGIPSLHQLKSDLTEALLKVEKKELEIDSWLSNHQAKDVVEPDDILKLADKWSEQIFDAYAEHQAIEDALYFMDRALSNDTIELPVFLKEVRKLARKQFLLLELIRNIHERQHEAFGPSAAAASQWRK